MSLTLIAGPCAVESREQTVATARRVAAAGASMLRGGATSRAPAGTASRGSGATASACWPRRASRPGCRS